MAFPATGSARTHFGRRSFSPKTDLGRTAPPVHHRRAKAHCCHCCRLRQIGIPFPIRRTSPVMTNKRIRNLLDPARNAAVMAPPSTDPYPADYPAALSVSLPLHPDHLFDPAPNAKPRKAQGFAGFGPGAFIPLTFILCHK